MHAVKKLSRRVGEGVGLTKSNEDPDVTSYKKGVESNTKQLRELNKLIDDSNRSYGDFAKKSEGFHETFADIPIQMKSDLIRKVDDALNNATNLHAATNLSDVRRAQELIKSFIHESDKTCTVEYQYCNESRVDYQHYTEKMKRSSVSMDEGKRSENELKLEKAEDTYKIRLEALKDKMQRLLDRFPLMFEIGSIALCRMHGANFDGIQGHQRVLDEVANEHGAMLDTDFESLNLQSKKSIVKQALGLEEPAEGAPAGGVAPTTTV